jgi:hypothetical protein
MTVKFDAHRDKELIEAGTHFYCQGHLTAIPLDDISPDARYCQGCYDFLRHEAELLPEKSRKPAWIPQHSAKIEDTGLAVVVELHPRNLSTPKAINSQVDKLPSGAITKPGPRPVKLPDERIRELSEQGIGSKAIASILEKEFHIVISYKTVQRRLQISMFN